MKDQDRIRWTIYDLESNLIRACLMLLDAGAGDESQRERLKGMEGYYYWVFPSCRMSKAQDAQPPSPGISDSKLLVP